MLSFAEGDEVYYQSPSSALASGPAVVVDVWVEGDRTEPEYVVRMREGIRVDVRAARSELTAASDTPSG